MIDKVIKQKNKTNSKELVKNSIFVNFLQTIKYLQTIYIKL